MVLLQFLQELIKEAEVKALCAKAREILVEESNVQRVDAPVTVRTGRRSACDRFLETDSVLVRHVDRPRRGYLCNACLNSSIGEKQGEKGEMLALKRGKGQLPSKNVFLMEMRRILTVTCRFSFGNVLIG